MSGSGSGAGGATTVQNLVVSAVSPRPSASPLHPGGPAGWIYLTIQNPNPFAVKVSGRSWGRPVSTNTTACASANIMLDSGAPTTANIAVAANSTSGALQIMNVLDLSHGAPKGCQGVIFDIPVTVTGAQQ